MSDVGVIEMTNKELLLLSYYVRKVLREKESGKIAGGDVGKEAADNWFYHITHYHISDFREKFKRGVAMGRTQLGLPAVETALIDQLREKFNRDDDTSSLK